MMKNKIWMLAIAFAAILASCNNDDNGNSSDSAQLELRLTDGPADYDAILLDIQRIEFKLNNEEGLEFPFANPGIYDLLELNNGVDLLLGNHHLPVGNLKQMRLILGPNNKIIVNGVEHPLQTPSAQQSGLKFNVNHILEPGMAYKMWIDFDAGKSIVETGNGGYILKPVIRTFTDLTNGMIEGKVLPIESLTTVYAMQNQSDTIATALPNLDGYFKFMGLPEGNYRLVFDAQNPAFSDKEISPVSVVFGQINNLGDIIMTP